jgi:hypothetical protein
MPESGFGVLGTRATVHDQILANRGEEFAWPQSSLGFGLSGARPERMAEPLSRMSPEPGAQVRCRQNPRDPFRRSEKNLV